MQSGDCFAVCEAQTYINSDLPKKEFLLSAISNFILSYLIVFAEKKDFSPAVETVRSEILKGVFRLHRFLLKTALNAAVKLRLYQKSFQKRRARLRTTSLFKRAYVACKPASVKWNFKQVFLLLYLSDSRSLRLFRTLYFSRVFKKYFGVSPSEYR